MTPEALSRSATALENAEPQEILDWITRAVPRVALTSSFGADAVVLLHMVSRLDRDVDVLFLDTGYHFAQTLAFRDELESSFGLTVRNVRPALDVETHERLNGPLYATDPDRCCALRKVGPLEDALDSYDAWITGIRRSQTEERAAVPVLSTERARTREIVKVAPLARWRAEDVASYLDQWGLQRHPLTARGYLSIGCAPCTSPVREGEDLRSGRWAAFSGKTECGLHRQESPA